MSATSLRVDMAAVTACAQRLGAVVETLFAPLELLAGHLLAAWQVSLSAGRRFSTADLALLEPLIFESLDAVPEYDGAGFVMAIGSLEDRDRYLEWWRRAEAASYQPLILNLDPSSPDLYDYDGMDWFVAGRTEGRRYVSGPLIDLPCAESHIMTFSRPMSLHGRFIGVAGADVSMARLEALIVPPMRRIGAPSVLVNANRRVIAASDARWAAGDKLRGIPTPDSETWQATTTVTVDQGWVLAVAR